MKGIFRAKPKNWRELPGEDRWIEGLPVYVKGKMCMIEDYKDTGDAADLEMEQEVPKMSFTEIDIKTLCRAMELTDANGRQIWEHDMIQHVESDTIGEVIWGQEEYVRWYVDDAMIDIQQFTTEMWQESVIVGNVFDNPEMVKRVTFNHAWRTYMESQDEICSFTNAMYNIGFFNGTETDQTQFDICGTITPEATKKELEELFRTFCKENGYPEDQVLYIEYVGTIPTEILEDSLSEPGGHEEEISTDKILAAICEALEISALKMIREITNVPGDGIRIVLENGQKMRLCVHKEWEKDSIPTNSSGS